ncbi:cytochrome P450 4C1-like [Zerene cesonia]|uniref:cytochrome P450 4C1-like n=1 Tax=Zerene cesonia TaxID=33412 RepID=UPI0018E4FD55|nr:cytochrome P450 4C1-like [Zerene cesonia]
MDFNVDITVDMFRALSVLVILWYFWFRYKRRKLNELAARIPAFPGLFLFMGAFQFAHNTSDWLTNPEDTEFVLKNCLEKEDLVTFLKSIVGNASAFAPVSQWIYRRKILAPTFSPKTIFSYMDMVSDESLELVKKLSLDNRIGNGPFSIWKYVSTYTLSSLCATALGLKLSLQDSDVPVIKAVLDIFKLLTNRMVHLWLWPDWLYRRTSQYAEYKKSIGILYGLTDEILKNKRDEICQSDDICNPGANKTQCFLDHLLEGKSNDGSGLTDVEIRDEISLFLLAGTDTSAIAICNTLKLFGKYPEVQEKIYAELISVLGDSDRPLHKNDLKELKYMNRVVKESLRLYPPVPIIVRKTKKEITLPSGTTLPNKTGIIIFIWGVNRDPNYWGPNANCFDPDRFLSPNTNLLTTFSLGPRNCVGYQFAFIVIKVALVEIVRRYKVVGEREDSNIPKINSTFSIMLRDRDGYEISLEER